MAKSNSKTDPEYKGELTGKHLKDGPLEDRKCTDFLCLILFLAFWGGMGVAGFVAFKNGDPWAVTYAYDQKGVACGTGNRTGFPYLLFINDGSESPYRLNNTICVQSCTISDDSDCYSGADFNISSSTCTSQGSYPNELFFKRVCLPTSADAKQNLVNSGLNFGFFTRAASDLLTTWPMIFAVGGFALVFGFVYILLMKYFSGLIIWGLLAATVVGSGGLGYVAFTTDPNSALAGLASLSPGGLKAIAYSCWAFAGIVLLLTICLNNKISLSIAILKAAAHFLQDEPGVLIVPPIFFVLTMAFYVGWTLVAAYIVGMNDFKTINGNPYVDIDWTPKAGGLLAYHFFALLWNHAFGIAISQFIIASTVCLWYFKQGTKKCGVSPVGASFKRSFYHMGSLAFGSFLIGLLEFVKHLLHFITNRVTAIPAAEGGKPGFFLACCNCCIGCFEKSMKFLTEHAYIQIAMTGENFCKATKEAFFLALRNVVRFSMVHIFASMFLKLGQFIVAGCATFLGYLIITQAPAYKDNVMSPIVPSIFFFLCSYVVAHTFMSIYGMSADTIIHCFALDEEIHDGAVVHAPEELREYVDHHPLNKKLLVED